MVSRSRALLLSRTLLALAAIAAPSLAAADSNDIVLSRLTKIQVDGDGMPVGAIGLNHEFRALASQLGVVMAPRLLGPADTLGFGGFQITADWGSTSIASSEDYWRVLRGSEDPSTSGASHGAGALTTVGMFARKGMWFPLPSFEVGAGFVHLVNSNVWAAQGYAKFALHEGYHDLPLPSVAVRGAASRVIGAGDLDLTVGSVDVSVSKHVGVGGTWNVDPYGGWNLLLIVPRSQVVDPTPGVDQLLPANAGDALLNVVFDDQDTILRHKFFAGARFGFYIATVTIEGHVALAGSSVDDRGGTTTTCMPDADTEACDAADSAGAQAGVNLSAGFEF